MKKIFLLAFPFFLFSCAPKATSEQQEAYNACKKTILDNEELFLATASSKEKKDSLKDYVADLKACNLDQLIEKLDVEPEQINILVYSVCFKAESVKNIQSIQNELLSTDSLINALDKATGLDSVK